MKFRRIWAMILRYLYATRDSTRIIEYFFWPMIDIGFFGFIASWSGSLASEANLVRIFVTVLVFWQMIYRANFEICVNLMDDFREGNIIHIAASPLRKGEWVLSMMLSGMMKIFFTLFYGAFVGWLFFGINVFAIGFMIIPFVILCLLSGWIIGFFGAGIIAYKGNKLQQLPWVIVTLAAIFSAIFYPIHILPTWMRIVTQSLPMSYIFQGMRDLLTTDSLSPHYLLISTLLSLVYLGLAIKFFLFMFERSRNRGLNRLS